MKKSFFLLISIIALLASCKKHNDDNNATTAEFYYDATIGGVPYKVEIPYNNSNSHLEAGSTLGGFDDVMLAMNVSNTAPGGTGLGVGKMIMHNYQSSTIDQFKAFLAPGNYPVSISGSDGMSVSWTDPTGMPWDMDLGSGDQTGSTMSIISTEDAPSPIGTFYLKAKVQFNVKLYDINGVMKQASGTIVGLFGKI